MEKTLEEQLAQAREALEILRRYNPLRGDFDAFLLEVAEWGLGQRTIGDEPTDEKPVPEDFGFSL